MATWRAERITQDTTMNRRLRHTVSAEETARREKRQRLQLVLKQRVVEAATAAANATLNPSGTATESAVSSFTSAVASAPVAEDEYEEEIIEQQKLLASASAQWRYLEDSQQAMCIALNRRQTMFAIGEKEGRISIWDNTTMRVITKELDPTSIILPADDSKADEAVLVLASASPKKKTPTTDKDNQLSDDQDDSATNEEDGSVDGDDAVANEDSVSAAGEDDDDEENEAPMDGDDMASMEDNDSVDENAGDDREELDDDVHMVEADAAQRSQRNASDSEGLVLTTEELQIAKQSLKHVLSIAWSCDSKYLFAGCEEKSTRRGRLCVWDAQTAWLLATFSFDAAVNAVSAHPTNPDVLIVCSYNALPVQLNFRTRETVELPIPIVNATLTVTPPPNSRQPSLVVCCQYGASGKFVYCATSKSTVVILNAATLRCVDIKLLSILVQFVDVAVNLHETAMVLTSSKGIHEFAIEDDNKEKRLKEVRLYATGAVRAPWALCTFSSDGGYVVGMPIVRHRHVGESGLYTWNRSTGRVQHNHGVKDGAQSIAWDLRRDAVLVVSCVGAIHVLEEEFKTEWPGTMYPAGFRLVTDNELDMAELEKEAAEQEAAANPVETKEAAPLLEATESEMIDVFTFEPDHEEFETVLPVVSGEVVHIPSIPITHHFKRQFHHDFHIERHFGLGQSVFEPLKSMIKKPSSGSDRKRKKKASPPPQDGDLHPSVEHIVANNSKSKSKSKSNKKRRR